MSIAILDAGCAEICEAIFSIIVGNERIDITGMGQTAPVGISKYKSLIQNRTKGSFRQSFPLYRLICF